MAGNPKRRAEMVMLNEHEERIFEMLDAGLTHKQIGEELGVMRTSVTRWLNADSGRKQALADSRAHAAHGMAEDALAIADGAAGAGSAHEVAAAKLRIETRRWLAAVWNRDEFGEKQVGLTVNIGSLHLDALRQAQAAVPVDQVSHEPAAIASPSVAPLVSREGIVDVEAVPVRDGDAFGLM